MFGARVSVYNIWSVESERTSNRYRNCGGERGRIRWTIQDDGVRIGVHTRAHTKARNWWRWPGNRSVGIGRVGGCEFASVHVDAVFNRGRGTTNRGRPWAPRRSLASSSRTSHPGASVAWNDAFYFWKSMGLRVIIVNCRSRPLACRRRLVSSESTFEDSFRRTGNSEWTKYRNDLANVKYREAKPWL